MRAEIYLIRASYTHILQIEVRLTLGTLCGETRVVHEILKLRIGVLLLDDLEDDERIALSQLLSCKALWDNDTLSQVVSKSLMSLHNFWDAGVKREV